MGKKRFDLVDADGDKVGFAILDIPSTFDQVMPQGPLVAEGPLTDAAFMLASLAGFTAAGGLAAYLAGLPGWVAPATGMAASLSLTATRIIAHGWPWQPQDPKPDELTIKVEAWTDESITLLDEIRDKTITLDDWRRVARAVVVDNCNWSRPALCNQAGISQTTYHKMNNEFKRLRFAYSLPGNRTVLSLRAVSFLKKIHALPY